MAPLRFGWAALVALTALSMGCEKEAVPVHSVEVTVRADGMPFPGARIELAGHPPVETGPDGVARVQHEAPDGTRLTGSLSCPEGFASVKNDFTVVLTQVRSLQTGLVGPIRQSLVCSPVERESVLLVKTGFAGIGVSVDGKAVATTDVRGFAHVYLKRKPESHIGVSLDTEALPRLQPVNPNTTFVTADVDDVLVYAQAFQEEKPKKRKPRRRVAPPKKHIPVRL